MNCSRFRHLIQQRFDMDLQAQDERMLSAHLETCESCAKFHHQIQQVLLAADDVQLPDDMTPPQPEALARAIMEDLPEQKGSPFAFISSLFGRGKAKPDKKAGQGSAMGAPSPQQGGRGKNSTIPPMDMEPAGGSRFPHRSQLPTNQSQQNPILGQQQQYDDTIPPQMQAPAARGKAPEDHSGTAIRLKAIAKGMSEPLMDSREAQSTTRSLGEKFGMAGPNQLTEDQPLTLAESIRRKIAESQRATGEHEPISLEDELGPGPSMQPGMTARADEESNWMKPQSLPNRQPMNESTGLPGQSNGNMPMSGMPAQIGGAPPLPGMPVQGKVQQGHDVSPPGMGSWGKTGPTESSAWGGPPSGAAASAQSLPGGAPQAVPRVPGGAWSDKGWQNDPKGIAGEDADWGPPPQGGAWDDPDEVGQQTAANKFGAPLQPPAFNKPAGGPVLAGGDAQPAGNQAWTKPLQPGQASSQPAWAPGGSGGAAADAWGGPQGDGWNQPVAQPEQTAQPAPQAVTAPAVDTNSWHGNAPDNSAWAGGQAGGWQTGQTTSQAPVGQQPPQAPAPQAVPDSWATPPQQAGSWGQPKSGEVPPQPGAPVDGQPSDAANGAWGQAPGENSWGQVGQKQQSLSDSWGNAPTGPTGWGQGANSWGGDAAQGASDPSANAGAPAAPPHAAPTLEPKKTGTAWQVDSEQIETGTWRAFTPGSDALVSNAPAPPKGWGTPTPVPAMPPPPPPLQPNQAPTADAQNRWDTPIQDRGAAPEAAPVVNNPWGTPAPNPVAAAIPMPMPQPSSQAPPLPGTGAGIPKDSIMDRLTNVLSENQAPGMQDDEAARWDMPIQERLKLEAAQAAQSAAQAPAPAQPEARWEVPIQDRAALQKSPELSAPPPRWDVPIQERTQQLTPTTATPSGQPMAPPNPAWGSPPVVPQQPAASADPKPNPFALPANQAITASSWDLPVVEAQDQLHMQAPPNGAPPAPFAQPFGQAPAAQNPAGQSGASARINPPPFNPQPFGQAPAMPPPPPPTPQFSPPPLPVPETNKTGSLFNVDDSEIDKIFSEHLGIKDAAPSAAPVKQAGPSQPAVMKSLPITPSESPWAPQQPAAPVPAQAAPAAASPWAPAAAALESAWSPGPSNIESTWEPAPAPVEPAWSPAAAVESAWTPTPEPTAEPIPAPAAAPAPMWAPAPTAEAANPWGQSFAPAAVTPQTADPAPQPFEAPPPPQPFGVTPQPFAAPPQPFAAPPSALAQPFGVPGAPAAPTQPFTTPQPQPFAPPPQAPNPFAMPQATAPGVEAQAPKIVPVMAKNNATASGGAPAPAWGAPASTSGGFPTSTGGNGPAPSPTISAPQPAFAAAPAAPSAPVQDKNGLFNLDDTAMDDLFSRNLGVSEQAKPVGGNPEQEPEPQPPSFIAPVPPAPAPQPFAPEPQPQPFAQPQAFAQPAAQPQPFAQPQSFAQPAAQPQPFAPQPAQNLAPSIAPAPTPAPQAGLFQVDDNMMDKIFSDNLGIQDQAPNNQARVNVIEASHATNNVVNEPVVHLPPPKIEGLGRLDAKPDSTGDTGSGRIASIGKFLLDQKDLEKIGKLTASDLSDTKMKILTLEAASEIQGLLHHIGTTPDVLGSIIIGHDGLIIANTMPQDIEADSIGIWALAVYMNTETSIKKIGHNRVHQIVARTPKGFLVIADFGGGLLVTLSDGRDTDALIPLMRSITQVVSN